MPKRRVHGGASQFVHQGPTIEMMTPKIAIVIACVVAVPSVAAAQSLADLAKAEQARRESIAKPAKVITNESLRPEPAPAVSPLLSAPPADPGDQEASTITPAVTDGTGGDDAVATSPTEAPRDEASWRQRLEAERTALARAKTLAEALHTRVNVLSADFVARDDPQQRSAIGADRQTALDELSRVQEEIDEHEANIITIRDEARRAGVPAAWVR